MVRIYMPWNNLGALGLRVGRFYIDVYSRMSWGGWIPGIFINNGRRKYWIRLLPWRVKVEG